ncbi:hypothetical protein Pint_04935 [Pistacia integerrima]|uniref:Uncharacterized protein n=1 Tax=Pistacia integerrima TaxID=434235 RepID=A0ACC0Z9Z3_9ROSI|nr:hypothetical protein Pint_04935 [Pistacia integerrima]
MAVEIGAVVDYHDVVAIPVQQLWIVVVAGEWVVVVVNGDAGCRQNGCWMGLEFEFGDGLVGVGGAVGEVQRWSVVCKSLDLSSLFNRETLSLLISTSSQQFTSRISSVVEMLFGGNCEVDWTASIAIRV